MKVRLFTHGADMDGISCHVIAKVFVGDDVVVSTHNYDDIDKAFLDFLHSNGLNDFERVFITDLSISDETAERVDGYLKSGRKMPKIQLLDHHKTAERLNKYEWCTVSVNDENTGRPTCGAMLFFNYFEKEVGESEMKRFLRWNDYSLASLLAFVQMVRDWDTWEWKNNELSWGKIAKQLNDLFGIYGKERFVEWAIDKVKRSDHMFIHDWAGDESLLLEIREKEINDYIQKKNESLVKYDLHDLGMAGVVFADRFVSELGNQICENHPELDFAAIINLSYKTVSFRTVKDDVDVSLIAKKFGGGGHKKAAGAQIGNGDEVIGLILNKIFGGVDERS